MGCSGCGSCASLDGRPFRPCRGCGVSEGCHGRRRSGSFRRAPRFTRRWRGLSDWAPSGEQEGQAADEYQHQLRFFDRQLEPKSLIQLHPSWRCPGNSRQRHAPRFPLARMLHRPDAVVGSTLTVPGSGYRRHGTRCFALAWLAWPGGTLAGTTRDQRPAAFRLS